MPSPEPIITMPFPETDRPVILVDLDNVVYDFVATMAHLLSDNGVVQETAETLVQLYRTWEVWDDWGISKGEFMRWWQKGIQGQHMYGKGLEVKDATASLWRLSDAEWHIHIVTDRLNHFGLHREVVASTSAWLHQLGIPYRSLTFTSDKHAIKTEAIVDDKPTNLINHPASSRFLFPSPHNLALRLDEDRESDGFTILAADAPWDDLIERLT